jgi:hypothetical protein
VQSQYYALIGDTSAMDTALNQVKTTQSPVSFMVNLDPIIKHADTMQTVNLPNNRLN